ncbi:virulence RhuM family protein [Schaalia turicensis]|uniref:virulence RhuM family protein n=1 Tax=Schaalia turicensis TaxID=131111 RepID=UPI002B4B99E8|nr:virulence RhuM family protein [Schaalia turicensis]
MSENKHVEVTSSQFLVFTSEANGTIEVRYEDGTIWLTQKLMAQLFGVDVRTISEHLRNIFRSHELNEDSVIRKFRITAVDGKAYSTQHYSLDAIISVGYRVNSIRATQFRQWATKVLRDFTLRGYVIDRARMEQGEILGVDYFEQLLEEIREIRLSERRFYQKVTDIFATAVDYDKSSPVAKTFFATVQNKMHYAVHGHTAAELIKQRADASLPHMGLTSWKNSPNGKILRSDVTIGKNYLTAEELKELGALVDAYLNLAESRARRQIPTAMEDWMGFLDQVLTLDAREILDDAGTISKKVADDYALREFAEFRKMQDTHYVSDFDRFSSEVQQAINGDDDDAH